MAAGRTLRVMAVALGVLLAGAPRAAEQLLELPTVHGRTVLGEVMESQGVWEGKPLALVFWSVVDTASVRVMKQMGPALERAGFFALGVHPDQNQSRVQETLQTALPGWDSLPDTGFLLAEKLGVRTLPTLVVFEGGGSLELAEGETAIKNWLSRLSEHGPFLTDQKRVGLTLLPTEEPLLLASFAAVVAGKKGVSLYEVKADHRRTLLEKKPLSYAADERLGRVVVLMPGGRLWWLNLRGEKTLVAEGIKAFCLRQQDGRLAAIRKDGAVATARAGEELGAFDDTAKATACGFAADGGALVLIQQKE